MKYIYMALVIVGGLMGCSSGGTGSPDDRVSAFELPSAVVVDITNGESVYRSTRKLTWDLFGEVGEGVTYKVDLTDAREAMPTVLEDESGVVYEVKAGEDTAGVIPSKITITFPSPAMPGVLEAGKGYEWKVARFENDQEIESKEGSFTVEEREEVEWNKGFEVGVDISNIREAGAFAIGADIRIHIPARLMHATKTNNNDTKLWIAVRDYETGLEDKTENNDRYTEYIRNAEAFGGILPRFLVDREGAGHTVASIIESKASIGLGLLADLRLFYQAYGFLGVEELKSLSGDKLGLGTLFSREEDGGYVISYPNVGFWEVGTGDVSQDPYDLLVGYNADHPEQREFEYKIYYTSNARVQTTEGITFKRPDGERTNRQDLGYEDMVGELNLTDDQLDRLTQDEASDDVGTSLIGKYAQTEHFKENYNQSPTNNLETRVVPYGAVSYGRRYDRHTVAHVAHLTSVFNLAILNLDLNLEKLKESGDLVLKSNFQFPSSGGTTIDEDYTEKILDVPLQDTEGQDYKSLESYLKVAEAVNSRWADAGKSPLKEGELIGGTPAQQEERLNALEDLSKYMAPLGFSADGVRAYMLIKMDVDDNDTGVFSWRYYDMSSDVTEGRDEQELDNRSRGWWTIEDRAAYYDANGVRTTLKDTLNEYNDERLLPFHRMVRIANGCAGAHVSAEFAAQYPGYSVVQ